MRYVRKPPEAPKAEAMPSAPSIPAAPPFNVTEMAAAIVALQEAANRMQAPVVQVKAPEAKPPMPLKGFFVTITKRDSDGRALEFEVRPKDTPAPEQSDDFESGFRNAKIQ